MAISESLEEDFSEFNQEFNRDLLMTKNQLDTSVHKMLNFSSKLANTVKERSENMEQRRGRPKNISYRTHTRYYLSLH